MLTVLTKAADIETIKADLLTILHRRNSEAERLQSRLPWKINYIEIALHELLRAGRVVSFWTNSGRFQRQFYALHSVCDILFGVYHQFAHSSGLLTKAAFFQKPVIVSKGYCMEERVRKYHLGLVVDEGDVSLSVRSLMR